MAAAAVRQLLLLLVLLLKHLGTAPLAGDLLMSGADDAVGVRRRRSF